MDKKSITIGILLLLAAVGFYAWTGLQQNKPQPAPAASTNAAPASAAPAAAAAPAAPAPAAAPAAAPAPAAASANPVAASAFTPTTAQAVSPQISNGTLRLTFAPALGGGIANVALLNYADVLANRKAPQKNPYFFNLAGLSELAAPPPAALALAFNYNNTLWSPVFAFDRAASNDTRAVFTATVTDPAQGGTVLITRTYSFAAADASTKTGAKTAAAAADPHVVRVETAFKSLNDKPFFLTNFQFNLGTLPPTEGDYANQFLGVGVCDGDAFLRDDLSTFTGSAGFFGVGKSDPRSFDVKANSVRNWKWASVTNQYFATILQFDNDSARPLVSQLVSRPLAKAPAPGLAPAAHTLTGDVGFQIQPLNPGQSIAFTADYYVGAREYSRLAALGHEQEKAVHFAKLWFISVDFLCKIFVVVLNFLYGITGTWALAIIALTILIKAITWPLVTAQQRSAEKMRKFQGPMKEIREKYKDDPKRQQMATMELYKEHKINPLAGCLPVLIQIPIFSGLFFTFQSLAQLRFQSFLWITDLSMPDTIPGLEAFTFFGVHLHILPLFMGLTMLLNMKLMPMPNVEGQQKMIFYGMMVMFPVICYGMPSALMLYYSVQNVLTIFQTFVTRRRIRREEEQATETPILATAADPSKPHRPRGKGKYSR